MIDGEERLLKAIWVSRETMIGVMRMPDDLPKGSEDMSVFFDPGNLWLDSGLNTRSQWWGSREMQNN